MLPNHMISLTTVLLALGTLLTVAPNASRSAPVAAGLTPEQISAARTIVTGKCAKCHSLSKALKKDPEQVQAHMKKKAKLSAQEVQLVVPYLTAQRQAGTNLTAQAASDKKRGHGRKHREDDDD